MRKPQLEIIGIPPGPHALKKTILTLHTKHNVEEGIFTAYCETALRTARELTRDQSPLDFVPFSEIVSKSTQLFERPNRKLATKGQLRAALAIVCEQIKEDSPFFGSSKFQGFHLSLLDTLVELHQFGLGNLKMRELLEQNKIFDPHLKKKLESLLFIEEGVEEIFEKQGLDLTSWRIEECLSHTPCFFKPLQNLYVLASIEDVPIYDQWLKWLSTSGVNITVLTQHLKNNPTFFCQAYKIADTLCKKISYLYQKETSSAPWYAGLFQQSWDISGKIPEIIKFSAADALAECEWALRDALKSIEQGTWPNKMGLFIRNTDTYVPLLFAAAKRLGVPLSAPMHSPLSTNAFVIFLLNLLKTIYNSPLQELKKLLKSSYLAIPYEQFFKIKIAIHRSFEANMNPWENFRSWAQMELEDKSLNWLRSLLDWRKTALETKKYFSEWTESLKELIENLGIPEAIASEQIITTERDLRAQTALFRALSDFGLSYEYKYNEPISFQTFIFLAEKTWRGEDCVLPASSSGIVVASKPEIFSEVDVLYCLGMLEGTLPKRRLEDPILTDEERHLLSTLKPEISLKDSYKKAQEERDVFVHLCSIPEKKLVFSYPETDESRDNLPAFYLYELDKIPKDAVKSFSYSREELTPAPEDCISPMDKTLSEVLSRPSQTKLPEEVLYHTASMLLKRNFEQGIRVEELAEMLECPFKATFHFQLKVMPNQKENLWYHLQKIPEEATLYKIQTPKEADQILDQAISNKIQQLSPKTSLWERLLMQSGAHRLKQGWIHREFLSRSLWPGSEVTEDADLEGTELKNEMTLDGKKVKLLGKASGISTKGKYSVVHFYSSRIPDFKGSLQEDPSLLPYGIYLLSQYNRKPGVALEIDAMSGERTLAVLPRIFNTPLVSCKQKGLQVVEVMEDPKHYFTEVKAEIKRAIKLIETRAICTIRGDHCKECGFGELCRSSQEYGEIESPFEHSLLDKKQDER